MEHFNAVVRSIQWTPDYPKEGINFCDLSATFGLPSITELAKITCTALCIDTDHVIVGIPTRGNTWAALLASVSGARAVFLGKEGGTSTPTPNSLPLCAAGTVYSGLSKSKFTVRSDLLDLINKAPVVWIADDVCESGSTMLAVIAALGQFQQGAIEGRVRGLPLVSYIESFYHVIYFDGTRCLPGEHVFSTAPPALLCTPRGGDQSRVLKHPGNGAPGPQGPPTGAGQTIVYGPPSMDHLVRTYVTHTSNAIAGDVQWRTFPGGMPNVHFAVPDGCKVVYIYDACLPAGAPFWGDSTTQDGLVHALARSAKELTILVPYLPQATCERVDQEGTLATAQTRLHSLCAAMPAACKVRIEIVDIHQTGTRFYTGDKVQYVPWSVMHNLVIYKDAVIAFPDDGACKRFRHQFPGHTLLIFSKKRGEGGKRVIELNERVGPNESRDHVVIVDDLVRTGGTTMNTARILKDVLGYEQVTAAFVHADFDPGTTATFVRCPYIDRIVTTDSVPAKARALKLAAPDKVTVWSIVRGMKVTFQEPLSSVIVASTSEAKLEAVRSAKQLAGPVYTVPVMNGPKRPEQPMSKQSALDSVKDRHATVAHVWPNAYVVAIESYISDSHDRVLSYDGTTVRGSNEQLDVWVPGDIFLKVTEHVTAGEVAQREWNLDSKDAWIAHVGGNRVKQIKSALY